MKILRAVHIHYDVGTDQIDIVSYQLPGYELGRLRSLSVLDFRIVGHWPYSHWLKVENELGGPEYYLADLEEADESSLPEGPEARWATEERYYGRTLN